MSSDGERPRWPHDCFTVYLTIYFLGKPMRASAHTTTVCIFYSYEYNYIYVYMIILNKKKVFVLIQTTCCPLAGAPSLVSIGHRSDEVRGQTRYLFSVLSCATSSEYFKKYYIRNGYFTNFVFIFEHKILIKKIITIVSVIIFARTFNSHIDQKCIWDIKGTYGTMTK